MRSRNKRVKRLASPLTLIHNNHNNNNMKNNNNNNNNNSYKGKQQQGQGVNGNWTEEGKAGWCTITVADLV